MGTTRAALHLGCAKDAELLDCLVSAFNEIGWVPVEATAYEASAKGVAVSLPSNRSTATIVISGNDALDDGTLKELAVAVTRVSALPAVVTEIKDSDACDVILFHGGRQIDAIGDAVMDARNGLTELSAGARARVWSKAFARDLGPAPDGGDVRSADDMLDAVLQWIGADPGSSLISYDEAAAISRAENGTLLLTFEPKDRTEYARQSAAQPVLTVFHDDDDCPHHRVYPAPWPLAAQKTSSLRWLIVSSGAGFNGARIVFNADDVSGDPIRVTGLTMQAYPFFNGQIVSGRPVATYEQALSVNLENGAFSVEAAPFSLPDLNPDAGKRIVIVLRLECMAKAGGKARMRPCFLPYGPEPQPRVLPPVRVIGARADWRPVGSGERHHSDLHRDRLLLEINAPSILSFVAIMDGDSEDLRTSVRVAAEAWLQGVSTAPTCTASVLTKKHMTASGNITKKKNEVPLGDMTRDRAWMRWFSTKTDLQTLRIGVLPEGAFQPYAGFVLQSALRDDGLMGGVSSPQNAALHVAFWAIDHPEAWSALGVERSAWLDQIDGWIGTSSILQAHRTGAAWHPEFDDYETYAQTIYEDLTSVDWFRRGLKGTLMTTKWCRETLRLVSPKMWLCDEMMASLPKDASSLHAIADVSRTEKHWRVSLKQAASMEALERSISTILPAAR